MKKRLFLLLFLVLLTACVDKSEDQDLNASNEAATDIALKEVLPSRQPENQEGKTAPDHTPQPAPDIDGVIWLVPPTFLYDDFIYCPSHDSFKPRGGFFVDENTGAETDESCEHGVNWTTFLYDEQKNVYGELDSGDSGSSFEFYPKSKFEAKYSHLMNNVNPFSSVDSKKFKRILGADANDGGEDAVYYEIEVEDGAFKGKVAIAYGADFVSDFIYDDTLHWRRINDIIAISFDDKWGFVNNRGEIVVPFVFEHALSIDDATAFVKYGGRYGIISIPVN